MLRKTLRAVTLVNSPCDTASNALKVIHDRDSLKQQKDGVAICVKGLEFPYEDLTVRLMEWIEVMKQFNAAKISIYYLKLHPNIYKAMSYYRDEGFVEMTHFPLSGNQPNSWLHQHFYLHSRFTSHIRHEKLAQHDCFYR